MIIEVKVLCYCRWKIFAFMKSSSSDKLKIYDPGKNFKSGQEYTLRIETKESNPDRFDFKVEYVRGSDRIPKEYKNITRFQFEQFNAEMTGRNYTMVIISSLKR